MRISFSNPLALWALAIFIPLLALPFLHARRGGRASPSATGEGRLRSLLRTGVLDRRLPGILVRLVIGLGLILSLAGARWVQPVADLTVVFVLDLSDSVPVTEQERAEAFVRQAIARLPPNGRAAVVAFGEEALIERLASEARDLPPIASVPGPNRTHIGAAIRLALALFPEESQKRLVLLSDGYENVGDALAQADLAAARGVEIAVVPLTAPPAEQEAYLTALEMPASVRQGQSFSAVAVIESSVAQEAILRLLGDGRLLHSQSVSLEPGSNRVQLTLTADDTGFRRYQAELSPALDTLPQNNVASGFTVVYGPPRVLLAEGEPGEADAFAHALSSAGMDVTVVAPELLPTDLATLASYDAVVLVDVPAGALPGGAMEALPVAVRELGRGLVMIGGEQGYGAGRYLRTPLEKVLPVDMEVRSRTRQANLALVLAVDKSGSMGRCHCDNPNLLPGQYDPVETGLPKVDIAKDAVLMASDVLGPLDYLGVVAFDENAHWTLELQQLADTVTIQQAIGGLIAEGQTNIFAGLSQAEEALVGTDARVKHIILMTDGWSRSGDYDELVRRLEDEGITLSVVAAGEGSAEYLRDLALAGGGKYYPVPTIRDMPQIFLQETVRAAGSYIIEEPFYPLAASTTPILRGIDPLSLPPLYGYNGSTPKATAQVGLVSLRGDPVLAQWQYGLGRSIAWTSDMKGRWAADWVEWERFNTFAAQLVGWALPVPADERLQVTLHLDGSEVALRVDATDDQGQPRDLLQTQATLIGPDLASQTVELEQTAAGRYEGSAATAAPGTYLVQVVQRDDAGDPVAQRTSGFIVPYSPEYAGRGASGASGSSQTGSGEALLRDLTRATGGSELTAPERAFDPTQKPASRARPLWPALLLMSALLFPLDVGLRRLRLTPADWQRMAAQIWGVLKRASRGRRAGRAAGGPLLLGDLFEARERARRRGARVRVETPAATAQPAPSVPPLAAPKVPVAGAAAPPPPAAPSGAAAEEDTLARLRQARERAQRQR